MAARSPCPASAGARPRRWRAPDPAPRSRAERAHARQRAPAASRSTRRRHRHDRGRRRPLVRASAARRRRRRRRHLQLLTARRTTSSSTDPSAVRVTRRTSPARCERSSVVTAVLPVAGARDRRRAVVRAPQRRRPSRRRRDDARAAHRRALPPGALELDHRCRDHRLRAHFPLLRRVDGSDAECAFAVVHRGLTAEGGPHESGLPTFVSRRFVDAAAGERGTRGAARRPARVRGRRRRPRAGAHAAARHRLPLPLRAVVAPEPGRPARPARGPAAPGPPRARVRGAPPPRRLGGRAASTAAADEVLVPLERVRGGGWQGADVAPTGRPLRVDGAEVSAVQRDDAGALVVRVFNLSPAPTEVTLANPRRRAARGRRGRPPGAAARGVRPGRRRSARGRS